MSAQEEIKKIFASTPGAVKRQGEALFVTTPLYKSRRRHTPIYINRGLYKKIFSCAHEPSWTEMAAMLEKAFSTTIEKENSTGEETGTAYVDRQADPLDLSLSGNLGSGRAYYMGGMFNIKGERTPLATSSAKKFSDGLLEMERCIWETLVANALQGSIFTGLNGVLAILDMNETCTVGWRDKPVKRGKIVRIDFEGELDRVTHLFYTKEPLSKEEWQTCAETFGRLEGDKFVERLVHGTWSPGNISPRGHLIDFDTVGAVKGRSPQFSSTRWYHENYFGGEYEGQLNVIRAMTKDPHLNANDIPFSQLADTLLSARQKQISLGLVTLMGFRDREKIYAAFKSEIDDLAAVWVELARKGFKKYAELSSKNTLAVALHAFDFSAFFRIYPMQKRLGFFSATEAVSLMTDTGAWEDPYETMDESPLLEIERQHLKDVYAVLGEHFVASDSMMTMLKIAALGFVKKYDALHEEIRRTTGEDIVEIETRAYVINEDRFYMFPAYTASYEIAENIAAPELPDRMIEMLIRANRRIIKPPFMTDIRIYREGYSYILLDGEGRYRLGFSFFSQPPSDIRVIEMGSCKLKLANNNNDKVYVSIIMDNIRLCREFHREKSLHIDPVKIIYSDSFQNLKSIIDT